ncbi:nuclear transport factor 2 family protein [Chitinophaga sp. Cy-1792]|uniref:nuclear transport factor 2 family protein n=1 Tax=Chitinophaga sp. Cy-1792 TaxID=2608339 RepID=UPI00141F1B36|nr:nuclear transport factor 2 family protein [Chitinophaga sp. Cy-1792]NIG54691.1 hypothetical protein [Chitinophaga sp. Cy-1792]
MKNILLTALLVSLSWTSKAQNKTTMETQHQDSIAISQVLENSYFKGIYEGDVTLLKSVYYPGTLLFGDVKGQPYAKTLPEYLDGVQHRQSPKNSGKLFKGEIITIKVVNSIAIAEVRVSMYDFVYHEFLSFHKFDGKWLLVNKMISDTAGQPVTATENKAYVVAYMDILPAFEKQVKDALNVMAEESNKEPGCEQFTVNTKKDAPLSIVVYEIYSNEEAFQVHKTSPHAKNFFEFVKGKIVNDHIQVDLLSGLNH